VVKINEQYDVVVIGGGIAGTMAAIAAAREGSRTLLVERYSALGGMGTLGLVQPITTWGINGRYIIGGTGKRILEELVAEDKSAATKMSTYGPCCDAEYLKMELEKRALESKVSILYHTWVRGVKLENPERIRCLLAFSKDGDFEISGKVYIDATGDGDICAFAGIPFDSSENELGQQSMTLMMVISGIDRNKTPDSDCIHTIWDRHRGSCHKGALFWHPRRGSAYFNVTKAPGLNGLKASDLTEAAISCRRQSWVAYELLKQHVPGFENSYIAEIAPALGIRETRRIIGQYTLCREDVDNGRHFEDVIARAACPVDIHPRNNDGGEYYALKKSYAIPYRSIVTNRISNLIMTGRCISSDQAAHSSLRRMAPGFALGEAAGIAAHISTSSKDVRSISVKDLQEALLHYGAILEPEES